MEINENCVKQVKAYLEETLKINIDEEDVRDLVECILKKYYALFWDKLQDVIFEHLHYFDSISRVYEHWRICNVIKTSKILTKVESIVALYHEDYDTLADKITDMLSDSSPDLRS